MCYGIALGMNCLAQNKFVHAEISLPGTACHYVRSLSEHHAYIMGAHSYGCHVSVLYRMGSDGSIKVSDFGLSEDIYYFRVDTSAPIAVPFKWMPLESLEEGIYNEKTNMVRRIVI